VATDRFLYYNVGTWGKFGLAMPNPGKGDAAGLSANGNINYLASVVGRNLQALMFHSDAGMQTPPGIATLTRVHKLCVRARDILAARAIPPGQPDMEPAHPAPAPEEFLFFPVPYFTVRNIWLREYTGLMLMALTEMMQHQERRKPLEISIQFAGLIGQYVKRVYYRMSTELFKIPTVDAAKDDFTLSEEQLRAYNPAAWFTSTELNDTIDGFEDITTEDDREILTRGIAYSQLPAAALGFWPGALDAGQQASGAAASANASSSFAPSPAV
jgi:hypothetical protein